MCFSTIVEEHKRAELQSASAAHQILEKVEATGRERLPQREERVRLLAPLASKASGEEISMQGTLLRALPCTLLLQGTQTLLGARARAPAVSSVVNDDVEWVLNSIRLLDP